MTIGRKPQKRAAKRKGAKKRATKRKVSPKQAAKTLEIEQRRERVAELRLKGWSIREIARELGVSHGLIHLDVNEVLDRTMDAADETVRRERTLSLMRLDQVVKGIAERIDEGDEDAGTLLVKVENRRAKFLGLDAPVKQQLDVKVEGALKEIVLGIERHMSREAYSEFLHAFDTFMAEQTGEIESTVN